jgi:hypothetical protein
VHNLLHLENKQLIHSATIIRGEKMGRPIDEFKAHLDKATSSSGEDGLPSIAVIAADANGKLAAVHTSLHLPTATDNPNRNNSTQDRVRNISPT